MPVTGSCPRQQREKCFLLLKCVYPFVNKRAKSKTPRSVPDVFPGKAALCCCCEPRLAEGACWHRAPVCKYRGVSKGPGTAAPPAAGMLTRGRAKRCVAVCVHTARPVQGLTSRPGRRLRNGAALSHPGVIHGLCCCCCLIFFLSARSCSRVKAVFHQF